jgi:hypothetical protein
LFISDLLRRYFPTDVHQKIPYNQLSGNKNEINKSFRSGKRRERKETEKRKRKKRKGNKKENQRCHIHIYSALHPLRNRSIKKLRLPFFVLLSKAAKKLVCVLLRSNLSLKLSFKPQVRA